MTKFATSRRAASAFAPVLFASVSLLLAACSGRIEADLDVMGAAGTTSSQLEPPGQGTSTVGSGGVAGAASSNGGSGALPMSSVGGVGGGSNGGAGNPCAPGLASCNGECVDTRTNALHCGACGIACAQGTSCVAGTCACPAGFMECGGTCIDPLTNGANCGTCGNPCRGGQSCVQGACACPAGQAFCGVECVDVQSDAAHCGSCENACSTGQTCKGGSCACPDGQMACGDACVDVQSDVQHCGTCDNACTLGKVCSAGSCIDGGGALLDDGCAGPAQNLTIEEIAVYQTVKVPVMREGEEVPAGERNADVVAGRESLFRIFVKPGTGFSARQLSARVHIETDGVTETYFSDKKPTISGASSDDEPDSTFQVFVPGDALQSSSQYSVEVVECGGGSGSGSVLRPRFPETGGIALRAVNTGVLKIAFVPIESNSSRPDTSEAALEPYRAMLLATYPITDVEMTVLGPMNTGYPINWPGVLDDLRAKRQSDGPPNDVYYYGLLKPTGTLREFCGGGCTTGIGYVPGRLSSGAQRVAVGIGFSDRASAETLAHEVAHNHGRLHAPCGNPDGADNNFPYSGGAVGVWGFDFRAKALIPPDRTDLMGYCNNKWLSDYTYQALVKSVQQVSGTASSVLQASGISAPWLVLLVDEQGSRWGHPIDEAVPPAGDPEAAEVLDASGQPIQTVTVYRTAISDMEAYSIEVPVPEPGWHSIRVAGAPVHPFSAPRGVVSP